MKRNKWRVSAALLALILTLCLGGTALAVDAPLITQMPPASVTVIDGGTLMITMAASGEELSYQWYKNDQPVEGQTGPIYQEVGITVESNGARYCCYVQNSAGGIQTEITVLTVAQLPVLTQNISAASLTLNEGDVINLSAQASGTNLRAQWYFRRGEEVRELAGQTATTLSLPAAVEYSGGELYCLFANEAGSVATSTCYITVNGPTPAPTAAPTPAPTATPGPPAITKDPTGETVEVGGRALFIARADGTNTYTWRLISPDNLSSYDYNYLASHFPGLVVAGGNTDTLTLSNIPYELDGWKAACVFTGDGGKTISREAVIHVNKPASTLNVTAQPRGGSMALSEDPDFTLSIQAAASNGGTLSYQWYSAATDSIAAMQAIPGATNSSWKPERREGTTYYRVRVTLTANGVESEPFYSDTVPVTFTPDKIHEHVYSTVWEHNDISHWHQCTCGAHSDEDFHSYEWTELKAPTTSEDGQQKGVCTVCGYETIQPIPAGSYTPAPSAAQPQKTSRGLATWLALPQKASRGLPTGFWMVLLGVLAVGVIVAAVLLIRRVLREDDEEYDDEYEEEDEYEDPDDKT